MAKYIKTNGEIREVKPKNVKDFKLDELKEFVEGYIEIVIMSDQTIMVVNEEGAFTKEVNPVATAMYDRSHQFPETIHGNVLWCHKSQVL